MMVAAGINISIRNITDHAKKKLLVQPGYIKEALLNKQSSTGHRYDAVKANKRPLTELQPSISKCLQPPNPKLETIKFPSSELKKAAFFGDTLS